MEDLAGDTRLREKRLIFPKNFPLEHTEPDGYMFQ
jgi:hypothetical protein